MRSQKNVFRAAIGSGHFPLTFNFVLRIDGRYIQCYGCGRWVYYRKITRDHVYPKSRGGQQKAPACEDCNIAKENMLPIEWALYSYRHNMDIATIPIDAEYMMALVDMLPSKYELYQQMANAIESLLVSYNG